MYTLGDFLIDKLQKHGAQHIFGIPGDYTLNFIKRIYEHSDVEYIGVSREDSAGYAADAYARMKGCGAVCVTYSVGGMNIMNAVAGAYAERSPVVVISGIPSSDDLKKYSCKHHMVNTVTTQKDIFKNITCEVVTLHSDHPYENMVRLYHAFNTMKKESRPIYIEFSNKCIIQEITDQDLNDYNRRDYKDGIVTKNESHEFLNQFSDIFNKAKNPVMILGHEIFRYSLEKTLEKFCKEKSIPVFTTLLGKSTISEFSNVSMGCFSELCSSPNIVDAVHQSDCIISLGFEPTDVDGFSFISDLHASMSNGVRIKNKIKSLPLGAFVNSFCKKYADIEPFCNINNWHQTTTKFDLIMPQTNEKLNLTSVFNEIQNIILDNENYIIISDIGESLFGMFNVSVHQGSFMSMAYYTSMGFSVPAGLGVHFAKPNRRPIIIVGDGAFQMCSTEISSFVKYGINPIVIVLNNSGYSTERAIMEGEFNNIHEWSYESITSFVCGGKGIRAVTEGEFHNSLQSALTHDKEFVIINAKLSPNDQTPAMKSIARKMCKESL